MNNKKIHNAYSYIRTLLKSFAGFVILLHALQAQALDFTPDPSRILSDLAYLPKQDQFVSTTSYSFTRTAGDVYDYQGAPKNSFITTSNLLSQTYANGINDDLTLRITAAYGNNSTTSHLATGTSTTTHAYGMDDPVLEMVWRVLDQSGHMMNWDLIGSYAPDMVQAIEATATQVGSVARGGQATTLGTALSYKTRDFTIYINGSATYLSRRDISDNANKLTTYNSNWQYSVGLNTQTRFNEVFAINVGLTETLHNNVHGTNDVTGDAFNDNSGNLATFNTAFVYNITPNKLVTTLIYNHAIYSNSSSDNTTNPSLSTTTKGKNANSIGARLQYMFD